MNDRILQCDCFLLLDSLTSRVPLILTDIPFGVVNRRSNGLRELDKGFADNTEGFDHILFARKVAETSDSCYIFCSTEQVSDIRRVLVENGMTTRLCIWEKTNPSPMNGQHVWLSGVEVCVYGKHRGAIFNGHCQNTVWRYPIPRKINHPTPKPIALVKFLIETSTKPDDLVVDPCVGGGTTALAARLAGRRFLVSDTNPDCILWTKELLKNDQSKVDTEVEELPSLPPSSKRSSPRSLPG